MLLIALGKLKLSTIGKGAKNHPRLLLKGFKMLHKNKTQFFPRLQVQRARQM